MTIRFSRWGVLSSLVLVLLSSQSGAQVFPRGNGLSLADVTRFDLHIQVASWQDVQADPTDFRLQTQQAFESRLKNAGIRRQPAGRDYLVCQVRAIQQNTAVAYTTTLEYWGLRSTDVHTLLWQNGALATAAAADFNADMVAEVCANTFIHEWSKWNPAG